MQAAATSLFAKYPLQTTNRIGNPEQWMTMAHSLLPVRWPRCSRREKKKKSCTCCIKLNIYAQIYLRLLAVKKK